MRYLADELEGSNPMIAHCEEWDVSLASDDCNNDDGNATPFAKEDMYVDAYG